MNKVVFLIFIFFTFQSGAQKDSIKSFAFSLDAGLILNNSYSHYNPKDSYRTMSGYAGDVTSPSVNTGPINAGTCLGVGFHFGKPKKLPWFFALSLSLTGGSYHMDENRGPTYSKNGSYYTTADYIETKITQLLLNYETGLKTRFSKNIYMQNALSLQQNLYKVNENVGYSTVTTTSMGVTTIVESPINSTETKAFNINAGFVTASYRFALYYRFIQPKHEYHVFASRSFSLGDYVLPLWTLGFRCFLE